MSEPIYWDGPLIADGVERWSAKLPDGNVLVVTKYGAGQIGYCAVCSGQIIAVGKKPTLPEAQYEARKGLIQHAEKLADTARRVTVR